MYLVYIFMQILLLIYLMLCFLFYLCNKYRKLEGHSSLDYSGTCSLAAGSCHNCLDLTFTARGELKWSWSGTEGSSLRRAAPSGFQVLEAYMPCCPVYGSLSPLCCLVGLYFTEIFGATGILKFEFIFIIYYLLLSLSFQYLYAGNKYMSFHTAWVPDTSP